MIKKSTQTNMAESISPWEFESQPNLKPASTIRILKHSLNRSNNSAKEFNVRAPTQTRSHSRSSIKLQKRVPTEVLTIEKRNPQTEIRANSLSFKLPHNLTAFPLKKMMQKSIRHVSLTQRDYPTLREKPSMRNFKKQIEQLAKLSIRDQKYSSQLAKNVVKDPLFQKYALRKIEIYEQSQPKTVKRSLLQKRIPIESKKHILDRILSRFE